MGHRSATRQAAAVAIQCWARRRLEITHCMQLLGLLHIIRHEEQNAEDALLLRELASGEDGNNSADNGVNNTKDIAASAALLTDLAMSYSERLQQENYTRRLLLESYADQLRGASDAARRAVRQHRGIRRLSLLPRELLREVLEEVRDSTDARQVHCNARTQNLILQCRALAKTSEESGGAVARGVAGAVHTKISREPSKPSESSKPSDSSKPSGPTESSAVHAVADGPHSESSAAEASDKCSDAADDSTDGSGSDAYDDEIYYERQRVRGETRTARISSALQMANVETPTDNAAACDAFMQEFGDVGGVAFPALAAAHMKSTTATAVGRDVHCCAVCELRGDEEGAGLVACGCGRHVHSECAERRGNGELRCSRFCQAAL